MEHLGARTAAGGAWRRGRRLASAARDGRGRRREPGGARACSEAGGVSRSFVMGKNGR